MDRKRVPKQSKEPSFAILKDHGPGPRSRKPPLMVGALVNYTFDSVGHHNKKSGAFPPIEDEHPLAVTRNTNQILSFQEITNRARESESELH